MGFDERNQLLERWYNEYYPSLNAYFALWNQRLRLVGTEDIINDVFVSLLTLPEERLQAIETSAQTPYSYLLKSINNRVIDYGRRGGIRKEVEIEISISFLTDAIADFNYSEWELNYQDIIRLIYELLNDNEFQALYLHVIEDLSVKEISSITETQLPTVYQRLRRARQKLRRARNQEFKDF